MAAGSALRHQEARRLWAVLWPGSDCFEKRHLGPRLTDYKATKFTVTQLSNSKLKIIIDTLKLLLELLLQKI